MFDGVLEFGFDGVLDFGSGLDFWFDRVVGQSEWRGCGFVFVLDGFLSLRLFGCLCLYASLCRSLCDGLCRNLSLN